MATKTHRARAEKAARLFKLVSSTTRVAILSTLAEHKELPVRDIADNLGMTHSAVSHQLGVLSSADMVSYERTGRTVNYSLAKNPRAKALVKFLETIS